MAFPRQRQPEWMDDPSLDPHLHAQALTGLRRINWWSRSARVIWPAIEQLARSERLDTVRILDLASGGGEVAIRLARLARARRIHLQLTGCDRSPVAVAEAQRNASRAGETSVEFLVRDVLQDEFASRYDVVMCSLFLHHLDEEPAVELLRRMRQIAGRMVLVDDLRRTRLGYWLAWWGSRLLSRSPVVHQDGPLSVAGAFTPEEALTLAARAGLQDACVTHHWPQRYLLSWRRT